VQQKSTDKMDQTKNTQELAKNTKNTWAVRLLADYPPHLLKVKPSISLPDIQINQGKATKS
jgi:hypothetical protein